MTDAEREGFRKFQRDMEALAALCKISAANIRASKDLVATQIKTLDAILEADPESPAADLIRTGRKSMQVLNRLLDDLLTDWVSMAGDSAMAAPVRTTSERNFN